MKTTYKTLLSFIAAGCMFIVATTTVTAQAFHKNVLLVSLSEGKTIANYSTKSGEGANSEVISKKTILGDRDPLIIEYGISNHWGVGLSSGKDIFQINPSEFYGFNVSNNIIKSNSNEFTLDGSYHVLVNNRLDLSVFTSLGAFGVDFKGKDSDYSYSYKANGNIIRIGTRARYYFWKNLGAFGMLSSYAASCNTKDVKDNTVGKNTTTSIKGYTIEMGLCYRFNSPFRFLRKL